MDPGVTQPLPALGVLRGGKQKATLMTLESRAFLRSLPGGSDEEMGRYPAQKKWRNKIVEGESFRKTRGCSSNPEASHLAGRGRDRRLRYESDSGRVGWGKSRKTLKALLRLVFIL